VTESVGPVAEEVVACMTDGRDPTVTDLLHVAERIWDDIHGTKSAFAWGELHADSSERLLCLRAAQAALRGAI
jgi:hypothetical protein